LAFPLNLTFSLEGEGIGSDSNVHLMDDGRLGRDPESSSG